MDRNRFRVLWVLFILISLTSPATASPTSPESKEKIDIQLLSIFEDAGASDFIVRFTPQADLSPAFGMEWKARGDYVYAALQEASKVQEAAKLYLDRRGIRYQSFLAGNDLYIFAGNQFDALALAALSEVVSLRAPQNHSLLPQGLQLKSYDIQAKQPEALVWGLTYTKADQFWSVFGLQGDDMVVASIDTGVQWDHPALDQAYKCYGDPGSLACWFDPGNICGGVPCDNNGHGTATMGPMVADDDPTLLYQAGMAPNAQWIACKGCESAGCSDYSLNACADWILAPAGDPSNRPEVVNNSWGGAGGDDWFHAKVMAWVASGIFPTFPAGGGGPACGAIGSPGDYPEVFTSGAIDSSGTIAPFSSRGPSAFDVIKPNVAAPGVDIWTTVPGNDWANYDGSSFSSPYSAGAVALLWSCAPALVGDIYGTFQALQENAYYVEDQSCGGTPGVCNNVYGFGNLDILAAGTAYCAESDLSVTPSSLTAVLETGQSITETLMLSNTGDVLIDWEITEVPSVDWLMTTPIFGSIEPDTIQIITVTFDAAITPGPGNYQTELIFYTYPPQGDITIPVSLTVVQESMLGFVLTPESQSGSGFPGDTLNYTLTVSNTGTITDTYAISITDVFTGWLVSGPSEVSVLPGLAQDFQVAVTIPNGLGTLPDEIVVGLQSQTDPMINDTSTITTIPLFHKAYLPAALR